MNRSFDAQTLFSTDIDRERDVFTLTFCDKGGEKLSVILPARIAADLLVPLSTLAQRMEQEILRTTGFFIHVNMWRVGSASTYSSILLKFNGGEPYGIPAEEIEELCAEPKDEAKSVLGRRIAKN